MDLDYTHESAYGEIPVRLTSKAADSGVMQQKFADLGYAIDALEYWWGPYAWERVGYVLTTDGALEIPTNIAYPRFMVEQSNFANGDLFAHELGHHWWGDLVAPTIHNHMWLKEGPAEYSSHLFVEWKDGHEAFVDVVKDNQQFVLKNATSRTRIPPLSPMPDAEIYGRHTYYKGASILHNLRAYLGDSLYRQSMQNVIAARFDSHMDVTDFEVLLEEASGEDLTPFFDAQVLQPGFSTWVVDSVSTAPDNGCFATTLHLHQKLRACTGFHDNEPLDLTVWDANWDTTLVHARVGGEFDQITFWRRTPCAAGAQRRRQAEPRPPGPHLRHHRAHRPHQRALGGHACGATPFLKATASWCGGTPLGRPRRRSCRPLRGGVERQPLLGGGRHMGGRHPWSPSPGRPPHLRRQRRKRPRPRTVWRHGRGRVLGLAPRAGAPWVQHPHYTWQAGSLANGSGVFKIAKLLKRPIRLRQRRRLCRFG